MSKSRALLSMCVKLVLLAAFGGQTIALALDACSGTMLNPGGNCGTARECPAYDSISNANCGGSKFYPFPYPKCTSIGANQGDNCKTSSTLTVCASRTSCKKIPDGKGGFECAGASPPLGDSYGYQAAGEQGECIAE